MITFILIAVFAILAVGLGLMAYASSNRKRRGQAERTNPAAVEPEEHRAPGLD